MSVLSVISLIRVIHLLCVSVRARAAPLINALIRFPQSFPLCPLFSLLAAFPLSAAPDFLIRWRGENRTFAEKQRWEKNLPVGKWRTQPPAKYYCMHRRIRAVSLWRSIKHVHMCKHTHSHTDCWYSGAPPQPLRLSTIDETQREAAGFFSYSLSRREYPPNHQSCRWRISFCVQPFHFSLPLKGSETWKNYWKHENMKRHDKKICVQYKYELRSGECSVHREIHLGFCRPAHNKRLYKQPPDHKTAWRKLCCPSNLYLVCHNQYCRNQPYY